MIFRSNKWKTEALHAVGFRASSVITGVLGRLCVVMLSVMGTGLVSAQEQGDTFDELFRAYYAKDEHTMARIFADLPAIDRFEIGMIAYEEREIELAELSFRSALDADPGNHRARLELGRLLFEKQEWDGSEAAFHRVVRAPGVPLPVVQNIQRYLDRIDALRAGRVTPGEAGAPAFSVEDLQASRQRFIVKTQVSAGVTFDSNINFGPRDTTINVRPITVGSTVFDTLDVSETSAPIESWGGYGYVQVGVTQKFDEQDQVQMIYSLDAYQNWLDKAPDLELRNIGATVGLRAIGQDWYNEYPVRYSMVALDGDDFLDQVIFNPGHYRMISADLDSATRLQIRNKDYETADQLDGMAYTLEQEFRRKLGSDVNVVALNLSAFYDDADADTFKNLGWSARVFGQRELPRKFVANASVGIRQSYYDEPEALAPADREDTELSFSAGIYRLFRGGWMGSINFQYFDVDSTFDIYSYERELLMIGTAKEF